MKKQTHYFMGSTNHNCMKIFSKGIRNIQLDKGEVCDFRGRKILSVQERNKIADAILNFNLFPNSKMILIFAVEVELLGLHRYIKFHSAVNFQISIFNRKHSRVASCN